MRINAECFNRADNGWKPPTSAQIVWFLRSYRIIGPRGAIDARRVASLLARRDIRTVQRWFNGQRTIPYTAWFTLVEVLSPGLMARRHRPDIATNVSPCTDLHRRPISTGSWKVQKSRR